MLNSITEEEEKEKNYEESESKENSLSTIKNLSFKNTRSASPRDSKNFSPCYDIQTKKFQKSFETKSYIETQIELLLKVFALFKLY